MKKRAVCLLLISLFLVSLLSFSLIAQEDNEGDEDDVSSDLGGAEKAYSCLKTQLGSDCGDTASTEQAALSLLTIAYDSSFQGDCKDSLISKKSGDCWGESSTATCDLKSTALAVLALDYINENVDASVNWLISKRELTPDLDWFLEIDANEATACEIKVNDGSAKTFNMAENKKMSGSSSCLTPAESNYYLKINDNCLGDEFTISCDKDFITTLIYKKSGSSVYYVSSETHGSSSGGTTQETVEAYCFEISGSCDYEGSLWATLALAKTGEETSAYIPYITAMADESINQKYLPSAFLYMLTNEDDYYSDLVDQQKQGKYWDESGKKFYDTALALLALQNTNIEAKDNTKDYLLEVQDSSGCWNSNNIRDTAFILYAGWPKSAFYSGDDGRSACSSFGHYCVSAGECSDSDTLDNFYCPFLSDVCCEIKPEEQTCSEEQGIICQSGQQCTGSEVIASDTNYCCLASCIVTLENECEQADYFCKSTCSSDQEEKLYDCDYAGDKCCGDKGKRGANWTLIILLVILIILVILAIIFREQVKIWWFRIKSKFRFGKPSGPSGPSGRPPMPPMGGIPLLQQARQIIPTRPMHHPRRPMRRARLKTPRREKDNVFEDTMKKLREMTK